MLKPQLGARPSPFPCILFYSQANELGSSQMNRGFTLIELMVTLAVAAILAAIAAPSFTRMIEDNRITTQANDLLTGIASARSEAIKRGVSVTITPKTNDYTNGWCVHDGSAAAACTAGGINTFRDHEAYTQVVFAGDNDQAISFDSFGAADAGRVITLTPPIAPAVTPVSAR
ncbi:prepilin-type N-terminal cleavage/methylation domain-containing protein [Nitrogeniibacter mangrovi]|uniref:Type II secretion system protein H n=1 Tax=Nitrogeniibacter mangrovi TaxID=2016596 RepID=A0A6C1B4R4_9RHOO|nr:GspH/FimT family protein [Nitrogeniibacter mangrovi]QID17194.1 prepilin-type N-terminal cleavage/methylation domain-containing protein [Nitrogeniibacter mangrovi]